MNETVAGVMSIHLPMDRMKASANALSDNNVFIILCCDMSGSSNKTNV